LGGDNMRIRFTYFNKITGLVESVYIVLADFDKSNEAMDRAENAIFKHLYPEKPYNNEIKLINYRILN
jgi:hypothetical protein